MLHIDISDEAKQDQFVLNSQMDELRMNNMNQLKRIAQLEAELSGTLEEVR